MTYNIYNQAMEVRHEKNGVAFVWDTRKAAANPKKHGGVTFEQAVEAFFDPFLKLVDASAAMKPVTR